MTVLFVKASISGISVPRVVKVPRAAMIDGDKVLLVREGRLEIRPVEVLRTQEDVVIVKDGIEEGELIVLTPPNAPKQGDPVNVLERKGKVPAVGSGEVQPLRASSPD